MSAISSPRKPVQICADPGCSQPTAYRTRARDAWCDDHITALLRADGLEPLEPFEKPKAWRLTRCLACGCEAHYRFEYTLDRNRAGETACRACYWRGWARESRQNQGPYADLTPVPVEQARAHAEEHGYDHLAALAEPSLADDPHHVRCRDCGRLSAERLGDIAFGCQCRTNPNRARQTSNAPGKKQRDLLKDSGLPVLAWWDHEANDTAQWETVTLTALREVAWRCPDCDLRFTARVSHMLHSLQCPACEPKHRAERDAELARLAVTPVADVPALLDAWADEADPRSVFVAGDLTLRRFRCPQGHHPRVSPLRYLHSGCPSCRSRRTTEARQQIEAVGAAPYRLSPEIAGQWHPSLNGRTSLARISPRSRRTVWWQDPNCGHEWQETPEQRDKGQRLRCPVCRTILDSLAFHFPDLAAEWSPANPLSAWQVRPTAQTAFVPVWTCSDGHTWHAPLASRANGSGCPECQEHGKSQVELAHHAAAQRIFGDAASGRTVRHDAFARRNTWSVDITVPLPDGRTLAIEYDGSYWHADKAALDTEKSLDLLAAGHLVARLREHPLPPLPVTHPDYTEFTVHSTAPHPDEVIERVKNWATADRS
ncbi:zinc-ribbon domain-containing protein [Kitasatospora griseola]|uniref:zinc-ribbon domain-containing protein n=1 Tax=Kitasatospora griseola TaxID=2064 RepID=UPI000B1A927C|nr:zinc-ribbon domain-containing protein [Kitasatospora griseola]